jgi:hypothetical protein
VTGWAALRLAGGNFFDGVGADGHTLAPVPLAVGQSEKIRSDGKASVSREPLTPEDVVQRHGIPCPRVSRALFDEMRRPVDWRESVVAMDMAAAADLVSVGRMQAFFSTHRRWRRARHVQRALQYASELSRSPNETRMRLVWVVDAGLPPPLVNREVFNRTGRPVGVADLLDPVDGVVGEYDGTDHRAARRHSRDVAREEDFRRLGLEYFKVTGPDLPRRARVVSRMLSTRSRARFSPADERAWTLDAPAGWPAAETLDELLDRREWLADLHADG